MVVLYQVIKVMRPHQYIKNGFVFIGPLFSHQWSASVVTSSLLVFVSFCFMASAVYTLNDIIDIEDDREHPIKRHRPLASGKLPLPAARAILASLVTAALAASWMVSTLSGIFVLSYFLLNILYSFRLKHVVILDVFAISSGFMLRIFAGTIGIAISPSSWLLLCGLMITLFLGFSKRRAELLLLESSGHQNRALTRRVLDQYSPVLLEQLIAVTASCAILSYGLYTVSPQTTALHGHGNLIYTLPFVIYGIFRYLFLLHHKTRGNDTAEDILRDRHLLLTVLSWGIVTLWVLA